MLWRIRRFHWGWGMRVDKDGNAHDAFVTDKGGPKAVRTKWHVKPRGLRKAKPALAK